MALNFLKINNKTKKNYILKDGVFSITPTKNDFPIENGYLSLKGGVLNIPYKKDDEMVFFKISFYERQPNFGLFYLNASFNTINEILSGTDYSRDEMFWIGNVFKNQEMLNKDFVICLPSKNVISIRSYTGYDWKCYIKEIWTEKVKESM